MGGSPNDASSQEMLATTRFAPVPTSPTVILSKKNTPSASDGNAYNIYYGAMVSYPSQTLAGAYSSKVTYTATATLPAPPANLSISPNEYDIRSGGDGQVTIKGNNLASTYRVWVDIDNDGNYDANEECTNLNVTLDNQLTCNVPTEQTIPTLDTGTHTVYIQTQAEQLGEIESGFTYTKSSSFSICRNADPDSDCQVDIDSNMIPVAYDDYDGNDGGNWTMVTDKGIQDTPSSWYDYGNKKWANAVTLRDDFGGGYYCGMAKTGGESPSEMRSRNYGNAYSAWGEIVGGGAADHYIWRNDEDEVCSVKITPLLAARMYDDAIANGETIADPAGNFWLKYSDWTIYNDDVLGYWVYVPRYAYEVQRRDAYDPVNKASANTSVSARNFDIVFETKNTPKKTPAECLNGDYQTCIKNQYGGSAINYPNTTSQDDPFNNRTARATHPAFTWTDGSEAGATELNG